MTPSLMKYNPAFLDDEALIRSFVARHAELERIVAVLRENFAGSNQHLLIIGPRGIGKTTLVLRAVAEVRTDPALATSWYPIVFGEETYQASTAGEFWLEALFHLGQQTGKSRWQQAHKELLHEPDEARLRQRVLAQLLDYADEQGKRLVLVVENLHMLVGSQLSADDAWAVRHTLMNEPRLMLLGTATSRFREIEEYNQALYELFRIIELEPLDQAEAQSLWTATTGQATTPRQIRPLQILTGGNPRLIRILSEFAANTSFHSLMAELTRLVDEHTEYFKHHLDNLPPQERKVFVVLADLWDPSTARQVAEAARVDVNTASSLLKRLSDRGAVTTPYKRGRAQYYQVAEPMYNIYHLMRRRGQAASRVHAVVRFMVGFYRDEELVRTTRFLVEEASRLPADQRREHLIAYEAILNHAREPRLAMQLVEATRFAFEMMPNVPESLLRLVGLTPLPKPDQDSDLGADDSGALLALRVEDVEDTETLLRLGRLLSEQCGRFDDAEAAFRKALYKNPNSGRAWRQFGSFLSTRNQLLDQALESYDRALALDAKDASAWIQRADVLRQLGRSEEALESYDRALALDAENAAALLGRGMVFRQLKRLQEAENDLRQAIAGGTEGILATVTLVELLLVDLHRLDEALITARESLDRVGSSAELFNSMAWTFFQHGRKEDLGEAEVWARQAVEEAPKNGLFRHTLACLLGARGEWKAALEQASIFLADRSMLTRGLDEIIEFFIAAVAAGYRDEVLEVIQTSGSAEALEPLIVAIHLLSEDEVDVAREVLEVAEDVVKRIEERRQESRGT